MTHLRRSLAAAEESEKGADSRVATETPLAGPGRGRLVITHSGVLGGAESAFWAGASAGDLLGTLEAERTSTERGLSRRPRGTETGVRDQPSQRPCSLRLRSLAGFLSPELLNLRTKQLHDPSGILRLRSANV